MPLNYSLAMYVKRRKIHESQKCCRHTIMVKPRFQMFVLQSLSPKTSLRLLSVCRFYKHKFQKYKHIEGTEPLQMAEWWLILLQTLRLLVEKYRY